jgi:hypothetical protein
MNPRPESGRFRSRDQPIDNRTGALKTYKLSHNIYQLKKLAKLEISNLNLEITNMQQYALIPRLLLGNVRLA